MYLCVMGISFVSFYWLAIKFSSNYSCFLDSVEHVFVFVVKTQTHWTYFLLQIHSKSYTLTECIPYFTIASERMRMVIVSWLKQVYLGDIQTQTIKRRRNCTPCYLLCAPRGNIYKKHFTMVSFMRTHFLELCSGGIRIRYLYIVHYIQLYIYMLTVRVVYHFSQKQNVLASNTVKLV